jgi:hypothetical protein
MLLTIFYCDGIFGCYNHELAKPWNQELAKSWAQTPEIRELWGRNSGI